MDDLTKTQSLAEILPEQPSGRKENDIETQLPAGRSNEHLRALRQRRLPILSILLTLDTFVLGGCVTLLVVRQLLLNIMQRLVTVDAQVEILNVLDHLVAYYVVYGATLLALILITVGAYLWLMTKSRLLR